MGSLTEYEKMGKQLMYYRSEVLKLTQNQLAEKIGTAQEHISRTEQGKKNPLSVLEKVSKCFNVPLNEILNIDTENLFDMYGKVSKIQDSQNLGYINHGNHHGNQIVFQSHEGVEKLNQVISSLNECITNLNQLTDILKKKE